MAKRSFDLLVAAVALVPLVPFLALVALLIKLDSKGPVFHRAIRIGKDGRPFAMYKFRTMVADAAQSGPGLTRRGDPRVTRLGKTLRNLKVDELPQLINVLKGDMSLVGPRPEDPRYVAHYTAKQCLVLTVRPGIVGPAAVKYRREEEVLAAVGSDLEEAYLTVVLPDKLAMDLDYVRRRSFWRDLLVLANLAGSFITGRNIQSLSTFHGPNGLDSGEDGNGGELNPSGADLLLKEAPR